MLRALGDLPSLSQIHRVPEGPRRGASALPAPSEPVKTASKIDPQSVLGDCDKLATNARVPLRSSAPRHELLETKPYLAAGLRWKA